MASERTHDNSTKHLSKVEQIRNWVDSKKESIFILSYVVIASAIIMFYRGVVNIVKVQDAWIWVIKSNITFNFILFLFLWGVFADKMTKGMPKKKGWLIWGIGFAAIILAFRFIGGMNTIFG